jgi:ABC-2 type transport system ATP-binding protein/lipopolysaccharide transport system ATP-binding protein
MAGASILMSDVTVDFPIYSGGGRSLKKTLVAIGTGGSIQRGAGRITVEALKDISLNLDHGDRLAIVGHNGAGKTTLLRVMAGVYEPTQGRVRVTGRVSTIFDFTLGLDFDATGYENIALQGMLLGLSRREIGALVDEIGVFTDLGAYLDMPIRTYSSGMLTRLAFAVATSVDPEVLLIDEWIATGDAEFFQRAEERLHALVERAGILVLASHIPALMRRYCTKAVWLEHGRLKRVGSVEEVLEAAALPDDLPVAGGSGSGRSGSQAGRPAVRF